MRRQKTLRACRISFQKKILFTSTEKFLKMKKKLIWLMVKVAMRTIIPIIAHYKFQKKYNRHKKTIEDSLLSELQQNTLN